MQHGIIVQDLQRLIDRCSATMEEFESAVDGTDQEVLLQIYSRVAVYNLILGAIADAAINRN